MRIDKVERILFRCVSLFWYRKDFESYVGSMFVWILCGNWSNVKKCTCGMWRRRAMRDDYVVTQNIQRNRVKASCLACIREVFQNYSLKLQYFYAHDDYIYSFKYTVADKFRQDLKRSSFFFGKWFSSIWKW